VFENVVVGGTDPESAARAVRKAIEVVRASGGTLHLVMATRRRRRVAVAYERRTGGVDLDPTESLLAEFERLATRESVRVQAHPLFSDPVEGITKVAVAEDADLIVVGSGPPSRSRRVTAVPRAVMDLANCAVLVV